MYRKSILIAICFAFFYLRRWEADATTPYCMAVRRSRQAMLIAGLGGLFGLLRLWMISHNLVNLKSSGMDGRQHVLLQ